MNERTQLDNPTHPNRKKERANALTVLELAKSQNRPVKFLKQGETLEQPKKNKINEQTAKKTKATA